MLNGTKTTNIMVDRKKISVKKHSRIFPAVSEKYEINIEIDGIMHKMWGAFCQVHPVEKAKSFWCPTAFGFAEAKRVKDMLVSRGIDVCL